jgi:hypothetical protein
LTNAAATQQNEDSLGRAYGYWKFPTIAGLFRIVPHFGSYKAMWENESLGSFTSPRRAVSGLVTAPSLRLERFVDEARRMLPIDLQQWIFVQLRRH